MKYKGSNIAAGISLGLFIGFIVGISISEIIGTIAGVLVTGAIVFLGFSEKVESTEKSGKKDPPAADNLKLIRTTALSIACIAGLITGIFFRTNNILGTSPLLHKKQELKLAGFTGDETKDILKQLVLTGEIDKNSDIYKGVLYSQESRVDINWDDINPDYLADVETIIKAFKNQGGELAALTEIVETYCDPGDRETVLKRIWEIKSGMDEGE